MLWRKNWDFLAKSNSLAVKDFVCIYSVEREYDFPVLLCVLFQQVCGFAHENFIVATVRANSVTSQ